MSAYDPEHEAHDGIGRAELDDMASIDRLTVACRNIASGMSALSVSIARTAARTDKRLAALEQEARGYNWPQLALLAAILAAILLK